jgi:hypothetical protein
MRTRKPNKPKRKRRARSGYPCPLCDATRTAVIRTTTIAGKFQQRTRRCPNGHEFETDEIVRAEGAGNAANPADVRIYVDSLIKAIRSTPPPAGMTLPSPTEG